MRSMTAHWPSGEPMDWLNRRWPTRLVALVALAVLAGLAWIRPLLLPDEGRYSGVAWAMLQAGDWATPLLLGLPFFHKPPLFYWITESAMAVLGPSHLAARMAPLLGATLAISALHALLARRASHAWANASVLVLAAVPMWDIGSQYANLDMLVAGIITATICCGAEAVWRHEEGAQPRAAVLGLYGLAGLGVLAKGLIGLVLPGLVLAAWLAVTGRWRMIPRLLLQPLGWALMVAVAAPWFVLSELRHPGFLDYFFLEHHVRRFTQAAFNNVHGPWFYPVVLLLLCAPMWPGLLVALTRRGWPRGPTGLGIHRLLLLWAVCVVGFFTIPSSKLVGYVLPALPPLSGLAAAGWLAAAASSKRAWAWTAAWPAGIGLLLVVAALTALTVRPVGANPELGQRLLLERQKGEPVWWLDEKFHDVSVDARLEMQPRVVSAWDSPTIARHDDWRRELVEAARFAPELKDDRLVTPERLAAALCQVPSRTGVHWLLGSVDQGTLRPELRDAVEVLRVRGQALWRLQTRDANGACRLQPLTGMPAG